MTRKKPTSLYTTPRMLRLLDEWRERQTKANGRIGISRSEAVVRCVLRVVARECLACGRTVSAIELDDHNGQCARCAEEEKEARG